MSNIPSNFFMAHNTAPSHSRPGVRVIAALILFVLLTMGMFYFSGNRDSYSDPFCSLIASQSIVENGTIKLDSYSDRLPAKKCRHEVRGHIYDFYPPGTALISTPFVYLAGKLGYDMLDTRHNATLQTLLTMLFTPGIFLLLFFIGRCYVPDKMSFIISAVFFWGSPLTSTLGTALWNHSLSVLFVTSALYLIVRFETGRANAMNPFLMGLFLFLSFFTRPTAMVFILVILGYLLFRDRRVLFKTAAISMSFLLLFLLFSELEYGQMLLPYYLRHLPVEHPFWLTLFALLFSPSRGMLVFSPFLVIVFLGVIAQAGRLSKEPLFWTMAIWIPAHLYLILRTPSWIGGNSYGPRLQLDALIAWAVLAFMALGRCEEGRVKVFSRNFMAFFLIGGILGIWINSYQGLFNPMAKSWGDNPYLRPPEGHSPRPFDIILDWRSPQFMASVEQYRLMETRFYEEIFGEGNVEVEIRIDNVVSALTGRLKPVPSPQITIDLGPEIKENAPEGSP